MPTGESTPNDGAESTRQLPTIRELIDTERARIERDSRRSQVMEKALEVVDAQDKRQFDFATATRDANLRQLADRQAFLRRVVWVFSGFFGVLTIAILGFAFFGNDAQRALAQAVGGYGLVGIAGFGVITTVGRVIKTFTSR